VKGSATRAIRAEARDSDLNGHLRHDLWRCVADLLDGARDVGAIRAHRLGPLAARHFRETGREVPKVLMAEERLTALAHATTPTLLNHVRESCGGPLIVFKGPEVAACYPGGARLFGDVDLLTPDAVETQRALLAGGFVELPHEEGVYVDLHHLTPLVWPGLPMAVEIHSRPKWPYDLPTPPLEEILEAAGPSELGVEGFQAPLPAHHAVIIAAHGWAHGPLRELRDLVDVAAVACGTDNTELARIASRWGLQHAWESTRRAADALFVDGRKPLSLRVWARHLEYVREATVLENHLERWLSALWGLPLREGLGTAGKRLSRDIQPAFDESWREKVTRSSKAVRHAFVARSHHDAELGDAARKGQRRNVAPGAPRAREAGFRRRGVVEPRR
jgi:hypothetical protein